MPLQQNEKQLILDLARTHRIRHSEGWENFTKNLDYPEALVLDIKDRATLQTVLKAINDCNMKKNPVDRILVRAAAGGNGDQYSQSFSLTPGADADVILRLTGDEFRKIMPVAGQKNVMSLGASLQIGDADKQLYEKHNLSLPTSSLIPYVTVAGLAANAGHGTGKDQPSFAGLIRAMTLCLPDGSIVRLDRTHKDFATICGAHLGLFGIVLDVELECTEAKKMQCVMEARTVPEFLEEVKNGLFFADPYVSVMYVPTYQKHELTSNKFRNVIIYRWRPVDKSVSNVDNHTLAEHISQQLEIKLEEGMHIADLMREFPSVIPFFMRYLVSKLTVGSHDKISVGPWYTMHYQTAFPWDIDDADYLFKVSPDSKEIGAAFKRVVEKLTEAAKNHKYPLIDAVYLRMISGTNGGLSTSQHKPGQHICGLDMVSSNGIDGYDEFKQVMEQYFINEVKAKPHWGKYVPTNLDYAAMYGNDFNKFKLALQNWYQDHNLNLENSMLTNTFFCQILQLPHAPALRQPDLNKRCIRPSASSCDIARKLCALIEGENEDANNLRKRLTLIAENKAVKDNCRFFRPACGKTEDKEKQVEKQRDCCNIV